MQDPLLFLLMYLNHIRLHKTLSYRSYTLCFYTLLILRFIYIDVHFYVFIYYYYYHALGALFIFFYYALYHRHSMLTIQLSHTHVQLQLLTLTYHLSWAVCPAWNLNFLFIADSNIIFSLCTSRRKDCPISLIR